MPHSKRRPLLAIALMALLSGPALAQQTGDAGAYLAARVAAAENDYRQALGWYDRALNRDPSNRLLLEGSVVAAIALGDFDTATKSARRLLQGGAVNQAAFIALLADQAAREDYAALLADAAAGRSIGSLIDQLVVGWSELGAGRMSEALQAFDALSAQPGVQAFGLYHKALALASAGDFEGADEILSGREAGSISIMRRGVIAHVQILSQLERNPDALALLDRSFGAEPDIEIDALRVRLTAGEALPFTTVRNARDGLAEVFFTLATALNGEADNGYTLLYTRVAAHLRPDHTEAVLMTAALLDAQGQPALAAEVYALIPPESPAYHVAEIGRADTLRAGGKTDAAIEVLQSLTRSHGQIMAVHIALGDALRREERYAEAVTAYDAALALLPKPEQRHWGLFYARAISHERSQNWDKAEADFRKALELDPDQPQVLNYLGYSFVDRGVNLPEALGMIERAVAAQPDAGYIIDSLAWAYFRLGRYADAVEPMEKASLLEPVDPIVTDHLGDVYWSVGRTLEAQFQWRRALSFDPEEKDAIRIRRKLEVGLDAVLAEEGAPPITPMANGN
ncbi:MAG: tetratricopeptide repeat protein [Pseudomonadota bacterium]